jgi:arginase
MKQKSITLIGMPMDLGARTSRCGYGPSAIRYASAQSLLESLDMMWKIWAICRFRRPESRHQGDPKLKYLKEVCQACENLADAVLMS